MAVNDSVTQNLLPVQAYFDLQGNFQTFIGQGQPFYATTNPVQSGLTITNSTIDSTTIGATTPSTGIFTNVSATTGQISTTPSNNIDIANKFYVDTVAQGLGPKAACLVATTANITLSGLQTIDGYTTLAGDRVLVKNQSSSQFNGIYIAATGTWTRAVDMDVWSEVPGAYTVILNGGQQDTGWVCVASQTGTINVTAMPWVQFAANSTYFAGTGLTLSSNTFSITNTGVSANTYGSASAVPVIAVNAQGQITSATTTSIAIANTQVSGLGTMSTQNANSVAITGGSINATTIGGSTAAAITGTTITATSSFSGSGSGLTGTAASLNIGGNAATATFATTAGSASTATTATTATNLAGGAAYSLPYQSAASTTTFLASGTGVLQSNSGLAWTTSPSLVGTNFSSIPNGALTNSSITIGTTNIALGATASTLTSVTMATPTISSYETYTASSAPSYNAGRLWYDSTVNSLAYYNDVTNNTLHIGEEIQLKVYNNTGSTINIGQPVYITSTSSGYTYPNVALAIANSLTTANVIGLANQNIPTGTAGYVTTIGLIQGLNTGSYTVGDTLYLSPYSAGFYQNTIPPTGYAIKLGTVAYVNSSTGSIYVNKSNLSVQAGNIVGQVSLANGGTGANLTASAGGIVYSGASALAISAVGTSGQFLQSNGTGAPTWATPVSYATVTDDTTTNSTRYPLFANQTSGSLSTEYTSSTKLQYNPSTGVFTSTAFSGSGASLTSLNASNISSGTIGSSYVSGSYTGITGVGTLTAGIWNATTIGTAYGGTGQTTYTDGQILIGSTSGSTLVKSTLTAGSGISITNGSGSITIASTVTGVTIADDTSSATAYYPLFARITSGTATTEYTSSTKLNYTPSTGVLAATSFSGSGANLTGVVTSVTGTSPVVSSGGQTPAISLASGYGDTQNPYASKTANYFLAAPNGSAGAPTFRAIVAADIPTLNQNTTGTASNVTGTVAIANGGTGQTTASAAFNALSPITSTGDLIIGNGTNSATRLAIGTSGYVLTSNGTTASWQASTGGVTSFSAGTTGFTPSTATTGAITLSGTLNVANGGTGVTTSTGSGSNVLNTSPTLVTPALGVASATSVSATGTVTAAEVIASNGIIVNNMTIAASYSIPSGYGAHSTGPVSVSSGQTVTVPSGSRWVVL